MPTINNCILDINPQYINFSLGSVMHGLLMELIPSNYAEYLHQQQLRPYSQSIYFDPNLQKVVWRICTLTDQAQLLLFSRLSLAQFMSENLYIKHKQISFKIININTIRQVDYNSLVRLSGKRKNINFILSSPTNFKRDGKYMEQINIEQILRSLWKRWHSCSDLPLKPEQLDSCLQSSSIQKEILTPVNFGLESIKIPAYIGNLYLKLSGDTATIKTTNLLLNYAEFAGVGIKTALGMGSCRIN